MSSSPVAILVVHGATDPREGSWLELCLRKLSEHTPPGACRLYVWSARRGDARIRALVGAQPLATLLEADPDEPLAHRHAVPLQRLYDKAREDGARIVVTLDDDAHPIRPGWLESLCRPLRDGAVLAGIWCDELQALVRPYVHPSALATRVDFLESRRLRLDTMEPAGDTLSHLTTAAQAGGLGIEPLRRSNRRNLHRIIAGVYADVVYHHAAGSRPRAVFWDDPQDAATSRTNRRARDLARRLLFEHYASFMAWLRGTPPPARPSGVFVLGMYRSGTSCLAGALERSGLWLGRVSRKNRDQPTGNHELPAVMRLHDAILERNGGAWQRPPSRIAVSGADERAMADVVGALEPRRPWGLKDPRLLLVADHWRRAAPSAALAGVFRHPAAVARSLAQRDSIDEATAHDLWLHYNSTLLDRHRAEPFPLVEFDAGDPAWLRLQLIAAALVLGLDPDPAAIDAFLQPQAARAEDDAALPAECRKLLDSLRDRSLGAGAGDLPTPARASRPATADGPPPRVSVVVTSFNQRAYLEEALASVLAQTWPTHEIIVADDASTDGSQEWLRAWAQSHAGAQLVLSETNRGIPANRNAGLVRTSCPYVAFLDGDDRLLPENLARQLEALAGQPGPACAYTNLYYVDAEGRRLRVRDPGPRASGDVYLDVASVGMGHMRSMLMPRELVAERGGFDTRYPFHDGYLMTLRLARRCRFVYVPEPLAEKREHPAGLSHSLEPGERLSYLKAVYRRVLWQSLWRGPRDLLRIRRAWVRKLAAVIA